jgi:hypothetical protein
MSISVIDAHGLVAMYGKLRQELAWIGPLRPMAPMVRDAEPNAQRQLGASGLTVKRTAAVLLRNTTHLSLAWSYQQTSGVACTVGSMCWMRTAVLGEQGVEMFFRQWLRRQVSKQIRLQVVASRERSLTAAC